MITSAAALPQFSLRSYQIKSNLYLNCEKGEQKGQKQTGPMEFQPKFALGGEVRCNV